MLRMPCGGYYHADAELFPCIYVYTEGGKSTRAETGSRTAQVFDGSLSIGSSSPLGPILPQWFARPIYWILGQITFQP